MRDRWIANPANQFAVIVAFLIDTLKLWLGREDPRPTSITEIVPTLGTMVSTRIGFAAADRTLLNFPQTFHVMEFHRFGRFQG